MTYGPSHRPLKMTYSAHRFQSRMMLRAVDCRARPTNLGARNCRHGHPIRDRAPRGAVIAMLLMAMLSGLSGCVLAPEGTAEEQAKLDTASPLFEPPVETRQLPPLPAPAGWRDVLRRAFFANGELESAYFEWKAALARIDRAATWPNSNVTVSFSYMFSPENIKAWNRTTISGGFDPSVVLSLPVKTQTAGEVALEAVREASEKFRAVKFDLQRKVLLAYLDLALAEEKVRIQRDNLNLLKLVAELSRRPLASGRPSAGSAESSNRQRAGQERIIQRGS